MEGTDQPIDKPIITPLRIIGLLFIVLITVAWYIPSHVIKNNPSPIAIPHISDVITGSELIAVELPISTWNDLYTLIHPQDVAVKRVADRIVALSCKDTSEVCRAKAIFAFVQQRFNYVNDPTTFEYIKGPLDSLVSQVGDCDDASVLAANLLMAVGITARLVFVPGHVYVEAMLPQASKRYKSQGDWVPLDLTCTYCAFGETGQKYKEVQKEYLFIQ